jgi:hypothetical protein
VRILDTQFDLDRVLIRYVFFNPRSDSWIDTHTLEHLNEMDGHMADTAPTETEELPHDPTNDGGGSGAADQPQATPNAAATEIPAESELAALTRRIQVVELFSRLQGDVNVDVAESLTQALKANRSNAGSTAYTTTRRMRVNVTKNSKGHSYDTTYELTSDDPEIDLRMEMEDGLRMSDDVARAEITYRQYIDVDGLPGSDDAP